MTDKLDNLKEDILRKIRGKEVSMRPHFYFTLQVAGVALLALAALALSVFICNFILFGIRINSDDSLLHFGPRGLGAFLQFFPWWFLALDLLCIAGLQSLLRQFKFGYRSPILFMLLWLLAFTLAVGFVLDRGTGLNDELLRRADEHQLLPPFDNVYGGARHALERGSGICRCTVISIDGSTIVVQDTRDATGTLTVLLPDDDPRATSTGLSAGDTVFIAGDEDDGVIRVFGVRKVPPGLPPPDAPAPMK